MIKKPFGKKVLSIILVIVITITPFSYTKADTYTIDDVYLKLRDILTVLNGYGQNIPNEGINDQIQELQDLFDTIFVDNIYSYVGLTGTVEYRTFMDLMEVIASDGYSIPSRIMEGYFIRDANGILVHMPGVSESIANVLNRLSTLNANSSTIISDLGSIITQVASILSNLNTISNTLSSILAVDNNILNLETNFYNYIQNGTFKQDFDNAIDTITWETVSLFKGYSSDFENYSTSYGSYSSDYFIVFEPFTFYRQSYSGLLKISVNATLYSNSFSVWITRNNNSYDISKYIVYSSLDKNSADIYILFDETFWQVEGSNTIFYIKSNRNYYTYNSSLHVQGLYLIRPNDIEYWELLSYFDLHRLLLDYESVNSSELNKLKQENQTFNNTLQNFNQLENQISTDFSNNLVTFNSNLTESTTMMNSLTSAVVWFSQQMDNVFNISGSFKMLFILPMVLGIALWFIGRGSFVLRSANSRSRKDKKGGN